MFNFLNTLKKQFIARMRRIVQATHKLISDVWEGDRV